MSLVLWLVATFVALGLALKRFDLGVYALIGLAAATASVTYAVAYFYL